VPTDGSCTFRCVDGLLVIHAQAIDGLQLGPLPLRDHAPVATRTTDAEHTSTVRSLIDRLRVSVTEMQVPRCT
jgi:hypothetical protein